MIFLDVGAATWVLHRKKEKEYEVILTDEKRKQDKEEARQRTRRKNRRSKKNRRVLNIVERGSSMFGHTDMLSLCWLPPPPNLLIPDSRPLANLGGEREVVAVAATVSRPVVVVVAAAAAAAADAAADVAACVHDLVV